MMKNIQIFVLLFGFIALSTCTELWLNTQRNEFYRHDDKWSTFKINAAGGSGIYDYRYYDLPSRWDYKNDDIYIPANFKSGRYQVKVKVYDVFWRTEYSCYVVIELRENDYDHYKVYLRDDFDHSYNIKSNYEYQERKSYVYPSWEKVQMLIQQGDIEELEGIVMKVIDCDNDCDDKKQFLTGVLSRIQRFLDVHEDSIDKLLAQNQQLSISIQNLRIKINSLKQKISDNISKLNSDLKDVESKIYWYKKKIEDDQKDIDQYESSQKQFHDKVWAIRDIEIPKLESEISELKRKWKNTKDEDCECSYYSRSYYRSDRNRFEDEIKRKQKQIRYLEKQSVELEEKEHWFDRKIAKLRGRQDDNKRDLSDLEQLKGKLEREIKNAKYDRSVVEEIEGLERIIKIKEGKIEKNRWEIKCAREAADILKDVLKHFREIADKSYYECQDYEVIEVRVTTYFQVTVTSNVFHSYVQHGYGYDVSSSGNIRSDRYRSGDRVQVARSSVFSNSWISNYGRAYEQSQYRYGSRLFEDDYQCNSRGESRNGRVKRVEGRRIYVESNNEEHSLLLGDCSSVDVSTGHNIPKPNDYIVWKGQSQSPRSHRVHSAICF